MEPIPTYSIVIPTYNRADYVVEAVESALAQTTGDLEVIVVDDGSQDTTAVALKPYAGRIRYLFQQNRGMAAARNRGISEARGEFVGLLDSDDRWDPELLADVRAIFDAHPETGAIFMAEREMDRQGSVRPRVFSKRTPGLFFTPAGMIGRDTRVGSGRPPVARRSVFKIHGSYDEGLCGAWDSDLWIRCAFDVPMAVLREPRVLRRIHASNYSSDQVKDARAWLIILERVKANHPEFSRQHPWVYRRAVGKNHLRLGRELLALSPQDRSALPAARRELTQALRVFPFFGRCWIYLCWSLLGPSTYAAWRKRQLSLRG